jgi:hypothetical protein
LAEAGLNDSTRLSTSSRLRHTNFREALYQQAPSRVRKLLAIRHQPAAQSSVVKLCSADDKVIDAEYVDGDENK